jgi:hypothetical protein
MIAVAEQQRSSEFAAVTANDILADRQNEWQRFTRFVTWAVVIVAAVLILLAIFLV